MYIAGQKLYSCTQVRRAWTMSKQAATLILADFSFHCLMHQYGIRWCRASVVYQVIRAVELHSQERHLLDDTSFMNHLGGIGGITPPPTCEKPAQQPAQRIECTQTGRRSTCTWNVNMCNWSLASSLACCDIISTTQPCYPANCFF